MFDIHICDFHNDLAHTFNLLYQRFPREETLWLEDICNDTDKDEYGMFSKRYMSCLGSVIWLEKEGFIRFDSQEGNDGFNYCTLTLKALQRLSRIETGHELNCIHRLQYAMKQHISDELEEVIKHILHT